MVGVTCCCSFTKCWTAAHQASLSLTVAQSLPKFMFIESVMPSNCLILCCPLLLLPSVFPSIRVFSNNKNILFYCKSILNPNISIISIYIKLHIKIITHTICFYGLCNIVLKHLQLHIIYAYIIITITYLTYVIYI